MSEICVCMLVTGGANYFRASRQSIRSVLDRSDFDVYIGTDKPERIRPRSGRVKPLWIAATAGTQRAEPFLMKFQALLDCMENTNAEWIILMDADALFVDTITADTVRQALGGYGLAMAEQTTIRGSHMTRRDFLQHYIRYSLACLAPEALPPTLEEYRFFNAGVVLGKRSEIYDFAVWSFEKATHATRSHQLGEHMIADQDYFQLWANTVHPGCCRTLSWAWNHSDLWDSGFPRPGAHIMHFTNFCLGPRFTGIFRMMYYRFFYGGSASFADASVNTTQP